MPKNNRILFNHQNNTAARIINIDSSDKIKSKFATHVENISYRVFIIILV